ncbi:MAG: DUF3556 domain-containing protein, partial [Planctomycetota bacterium]|nr:DUF3556 domain-containing protein [Planctomycetota bacterium]
MSFFSPKPPPYDPLEWQKQPWPIRIRQACEAWAIQGYGSPISVYLLYIIKIFGYMALWAFFVSFTPGLGEIESIGEWAFTPIAFQKAILWSMAFEGLGLGCASGPLTARYWPPIGGVLHFMRPGTTKLPLFPKMPILGGIQRSYLDVALYAAHYVLLFRALIAPELTFELLLPIAIILPILGLADKTIFLASRAEHYYVAVICFLFKEDWIAGCIAIQLAIWIWAAVSKLTHHFPTVVGVMTSNSPTTPFPFIRKLMYRSYPDDLRASKLAYFLAHCGSVIEFAFPIILAVAAGGWPTLVGLIIMATFHAFITSNFPMAVPIEWNVLVVYSGFYLFGEHAAVSFLHLQSPILIVFLFTMLVIIPTIGNFFPKWISFLFSMRYYAGNWPYSVWLFSKEAGAQKKLNDTLKKSSAAVTEQLAILYDESTIAGLLGKVPAFRAMHLQGRALHPLLPQAVDDLEAYEYVDGELVAGLALGWNFGDGHLHDERLLSAIQQQCHFEEGQLRCIFLESQP